MRFKGFNTLSNKMINTLINYLESVKSFIIKLLNFMRLLLNGKLNLTNPEANVFNKLF